MTERKFSIAFYKGTIGESDDLGSIADVFSAIRAQTRPITFKRGANVYLIRALQSFKHKQIFRGQFCKVRLTDIPHKGDISGNESEIDLGPNEGLIEKSHFHFSAQRSLLTFQENHYAGGTGNLGLLLSEFSGTAVSFAPVVKVDNLKQFLKGGSQIKMLDIGIARPTNSKLFPKDDFSRGMLQLMNSSEAATLSIHLSANMPGMRGGFLDNTLKPFIRDIAQSAVVRKAKATVEADGIATTVDLILDRLITTKSVEMQGKYPVTTHIYEALDEARGENADELDEYFGTEAKDDD